MRRLRWTDAALTDVEAVTTYIAADNPPAAYRMADLFFDSADKVATNPFAYRTGREPDTREAVVHPNYIMVYRVTDQTVRILRLLHARQQYP